MLLGYGEMFSHTLLLECKLDRFLVRNSYHGSSALRIPVQVTLEEKKKKKKTQKTKTKKTPVQRDLNEGSQYYE